MSPQLEINLVLSRPMEEDVDGKEMSEEEGQIEDSESQDGRDSRSEKTPRSGAMSEERRQKLREIEVYQENQFSVSAFEFCGKYLEGFVVVYSSIKGLSMHTYAPQDIIPPSLPFQNVKITVKVPH